jgi:hypothetical protein
MQPPPCAAARRKSNLELPRSHLVVPEPYRSSVSAQSLGCAGEGRNGRGLVVLDVEEAVQLGDLEQVADPLAEVH